MKVTTASGTVYEFEFYDADEALKADNVTLSEGTLWGKVRKIRGEYELGWDTVTMLSHISEGERMIMCLDPLDVAAIRTTSVVERIEQ